MKRILSIFLCVAMLASTVAMTVYGVGEYEDQITNENVMNITTDKDSYKAGETVVITAAMESIWGDASIEDDIEGCEGMVMPGAYGMDILCANLIYDTSVFTAKAHKSLQASSTILNMDATEAAISGNNPIEAKQNGAYYLSAKADMYNANYDGYGFFNGAGDLWQWNLTISANAKPGTYYLPVGPYRITDGQTAGSEPVIKFADEGLNDRLWAWNGNTDSLLTDREVTYKTNYDGPSRVAADSPKGAEYECAYVAITVAADVNEEDVAAAAAVDALIDAIGTVNYKVNYITSNSIGDNEAMGAYFHEGSDNSNNIAANKYAKISMGIRAKSADAATGESVSIIGGTCHTNNNAANIAYNFNTQTFQIAKFDSWNGRDQVVEIYAESEKIVLPTNSFADVEFIHDGNHLSVVYNGVVVADATVPAMDYSFYILWSKRCEFDMSYYKVESGSYKFEGFPNDGGYSAPVQADSLADITAAKDAFDALNDNAQALVTKKAVLDAAIAEYNSYIAAENQAIADKAINMINAIGTVKYPDSNAAITNAENYVATLNEAQLALVTNLDTLTAARAEYVRREGLFNQAKADYVIELIGKIGEVTFESRAAIEEAEAEYAKLNDAQKALVTNYQVLLDARAAYDMYGPIMNAEIAIDALGSKFFQGKYDFCHFTATNGYSDVKVTGNNTTGDFTLDVEFVYTAVDLEVATDAGIALFRNGGSYAGYNFRHGAFVIGDNGGFMNGNMGPNNISAKAEYDLVPGKVYTMTINFTGAVATIYLDGVEMVSATVIDPNYGYTIFYPQNVDVFFGDAKLVSNEGTSTNPIKWAAPLSKAGIDVVAPVNFVEKLATAEKAVEALSADQYALLGQNYKDALAAAKAEIEAKYAEIDAAATVVEEKIAAITDAASVAATQAAFADLTPGAQTLVDNYSDLVNANALIVKNMIAALGTITPASANAIVAAENAYGALTNDEKALVDNYATLTAARKELNALNAAVKAAEDAIALLQAGGSAIVNSADGGTAGSYSQYLDKAGNLAGSNAVAPYTISFDVNVQSITDATNAYIGGSSSNNVFVGYDLVRKTVFVANAGPWGYNSAIEAANIVAEAAFDLALNTWYDFEFVMGDATAQIYVDGALILETAITEPNGWFIYYPKNNVAIYDNVEFDYNGVEESAVANFTKVGTDSWTALGPVGDPGYYLITNAVAGPVKTDADKIAAARAAYNAIPEKAQYAVANYAILVEAERLASEPEVDPADEVQALIDALDVPANYADVLAYADVIAEAKAAYDALEDKSGVDTAKLDAALKAYNKALYYDADLLAIAPVIEATADVESINISWTAVDGAVKYYVYVDGKIVATTAATEITVPASAGEHTVAVQVAINNNPALGSAAVYVAGTSDEVVVDVEAKVLPELVVEATATENSITAEWTAIDGAVFFVTINVGGTDIVIKTTNNTVTLAKYVTAETEYSVSVQALIATGENKYDVIDSNVFEDVTPAPAFQAAFDGQNITWTGADASIYWLEITTPSGKTNTYRYAGDVASKNMGGYTAAGEYTAVVTAYANGKYLTAEVTFTYGA